MKQLVVALSIAMLCLLAGCSDSDDTDNGTTAPPPVPDTPFNLAVTGRSLTGLQLSWSPSDHATEYELSRSESASGVFAPVYTEAATSFNDGGLAYGATYFYRIVAANSTGASDPSDILSGMTLAPDGFAVTGSPSGHVDYTFGYLDEMYGKPRYQSDPIGLWITIAGSGDYVGQWVFYDQIEGMVIYHHPTVADYPPATGWLTNAAEATTTLLTPFVD